MRAYLIVIFFLFYSCQEKRQKIERKQIGDQIIETNFVRDTLYNGLTTFYSLQGQLEAKIFYKQGIKDGPAINYYLNGRINDSVNYKNGLESGIHIVFDSTGALKYKDYFFYGKRLGGREFYKDGKILEYDFANFDGKIMFDVDYSDTSSVLRYSGDIVNLNILPVISNERLAHNLMLYIISPPHINIQYSLGLFEANSREKKTVAKLNTVKKLFVDTVLYDPPENWNYFVQADILDSISNYQKVYIQPIELNSRSLK